MGGSVLTVKGRNLATTRSEIANITIGGASCEISDSTYQPGVRCECFMSYHLKHSTVDDSLECVTGSVTNRGSYPITITLTYLLVTLQSSSFTYEVHILVCCVFTQKQ